LLGPANLLSVPNGTVEGKGELAFEGVGQSIPATDAPARPLIWFEVKDPAARDKIREALPGNRLRRPDNADQDYLLVGDPAADPLFVAAASLTKGDHGWEVDRALSGELTREKWNGAAAVSVRDGSVVGLLQIPEKKGARLIIPLSEELLRR